MSKQVLIVEDEDSIALALEFLVSHEGLAARRVASGPEALEAVAERRPDLVLLDVMLPGRTGYDVCQTLRSDPALGDMKIVILTAKGGAHEAEKGLALGADAFFEKPFSTQALLAKIRELLGAGEGGRAAHG